MAAQLPPSDEELGLFADQHDPDFSLYGEKLPKSSDNVLKALGREVVVPVTPSRPYQAVAASTLLSPAMATAPTVPLHLGRGKLPVQRSAAANLPSPAMATAPGVVPPSHDGSLHSRPGNLQGVAVRSGPMRSPAPVVRRPPVPHQPDRMLRTVHVSPIPLGFSDTLQFYMQLEQVFGIHTVEECKLPIRHKGYAFVKFYTKETFDSAISRRTINLNLRQGTEADVLSLKPAFRH